MSKKLPLIAKIISWKVKSEVCIPYKKYKVVGTWDKQNIEPKYKLMDKCNYCGRDRYLNYGIGF